jgi:cobalamin biosynthesis protein CbiD
MKESLGEKEYRLKDLEQRTDIGLRFKEIDDLRKDVLEKGNKIKELEEKVNVKPKVEMVLSGNRVGSWIKEMRKKLFSE